MVAERPLGGHAVVFTDGRRIVHEIETNSYCGAPSVAIIRHQGLLSVPDSLLFTCFPCFEPHDNTRSGAGIAYVSALLSAAETASW